MNTDREKLFKSIEELPEYEVASILLQAEFIKAEYVFNKTLKDKSVLITELFGEGDKFKKLWEEKFAKNISMRKKKEIHYTQFLWHTFSYNVLPSLKNEAAIEAFDVLKKNECYIFYQNSELVLKLDNAEKIKVNDFRSQDDIYIVDTNFNWTYVNTHEDSCGPYFYKSS